MEILDPRIRQHVEERMTGGYQWPDPWLSLNPSFASGGTITDLVSAGSLRPECESILRLKEDGPDGPVLHLHQHQREAIEAARRCGTRETHRSPSGVEIHCHALDLAADPSSLLDQIRLLAALIATSKRADVRVNR